MSKRQIIILLGIIVIFVPILGFTSIWKIIINIILGLLIIYFAYNLKNTSSSVVNDKIFNSKDDQKPSSGNLPFIEHHNLTESDNIKDN